MKFDSEPVYNEKYLKIKSYNGKIDTNFHYNKIPASILLMIQKFLLMILIEKTLMKKILMNKTQMKKIKYRMCLFLYLKHFEQF